MPRRLGPALAHQISVLGSLLQTSTAIAAIAVAVLALFPVIEPRPADVVYYAILFGGTLAFAASFASLCDLMGLLDTPFQSFSPYTFSLGAIFLIAVAFVFLMRPDWTATIGNFFMPKP